MGTNRTVRYTAMHPDNWFSLTMTLQWSATGEWWGGESATGEWWGEGESATGEWWGRKGGKEW